MIGTPALAEEKKINSEESRKEAISALAMIT